MITQHMEYHNKNNPLHCQYCDKVFHFRSMLNKHIKCSHIKESACKFRCRFCREYFRSLKEKWDHEWTVHNVRKVIVDCLICGSRFRKYAELKRHCTDEHDTVIPPAKRLLRWKLKNKERIMEGEWGWAFPPLFAWSYLFFFVYLKKMSLCTYVIVNSISVDFCFL